jgi:rSAM/selenodomain-associated transferase 1
MKHGSAVEIPEAALLLFARTPALGRVKTRLQPEISASEALALHCAMVLDAATLLREAAGRSAMSVQVCLTEPLPPDDDLAAGLDGLAIASQIGDDLGERLVHAFQDWLHRGARRVVVIGSDSPTMDVNTIEAALEVLADHDMVLGPAQDGGYVLVGCSRLHIRPFQNIPWGTDRVLQETRRKLRRLKIPHTLLRPGHDLDTKEDLLHNYEELLHLEQVGSPRATRTLTAIREILGNHPDWGIR